MADRDHSKSRSPVNAARRDAARMSQTSTVAAPSQLDALLLAPTPARGDVHGEWLPDHQQSTGPPRRSLQPRSRRLRLLPWVDPRIVGNRQRRLPRRFRGPLRQFTS